MSDEELIARWDDYVESMGSVMGEVEHMAQQMRNRIEALVKGQNYWIERCGRERAFASSHRVRAERLEAAVTLAANRLQRLAVNHPTGSREFIETSEWADEARAALKGADHE